MTVFGPLFSLVVRRLRWVFASGDARDAEILALRHQLLVLQRQVARPRFTERDRMVLAALSRALDRRRLSEVFLIVRPDTVLGWHRRLVARHWTHRPRRRGRPPTTAELRGLIVRLGRENPTWGYRRIHGELCRLGYRVAASTVWKILRTAGIGPAEPRTGPSWSRFIRSQAKAVIATDFLCVDTATLRRFYVLFFIEISSRRVHLGGVTTNPTGPWTSQAARNLLMGLPEGFRFVVRDGAGQYRGGFDTVFVAAGIEPITTPPRAPQANAFAERWVRTVRHELLDRTILWNERQLRRLLIEYLEHYNGHRPPQPQPARARRPHRDGAAGTHRDSTADHLRRTHQRVPRRLSDTAQLESTRSRAPARRDQPPACIAGRLPAIAGPPPRHR